MESAVEARFEVPKNNVDPAKLRKIVRVSATGDDGLVAATCGGDRAKAGQAIGENGSCGYVSSKKDGGDRLNFTAFYEALLEAKGVSLGDGGPKSDPGRKQVRLVPAGSDGED